MKKIQSALLAIFLILIMGCEKGELSPFERDYFYYTYNFDKIYLHLKGSEIYVSFIQETVSKEEAETFLSNYPSLTDFLTPINTTNFNNFRVRINSEDTLQLANILIALNQDPNIDFANPVFTSESSTSPSFIIPNNQIVCDPYSNDASITKLFSSYNLSVIESEPESFYYLLQIEDFTTGFETLDIANGLYRSKKFNYCHPNFLASQSTHRK
jgi:hypothetical protein